jgi:hypothetical protein
MSPQLLEQEMTISQILRTYGKRFKQIRGNILMGLTEDAQLVLLCHIMDGMVKMTLK